MLTGALQQQQRIVIVGDFDCDGATSTALMVLALRAMELSMSLIWYSGFHFEYGYGLSPEIALLAAQQNAELLITVDNGTCSIAGVETARQQGIKVLITDHHLPGTELPQADAIVNPNPARLSVWLR